MTALPCVEDPTLIVIAVIASLAGFVIGVIYTLITGIAINR